MNVMLTSGFDFEKTGAGRDDGGEEEGEEEGQEEEEEEEEEEVKKQRTYNPL